MFFNCGDFNIRCGDECDYIAGVDGVSVISVLDFRGNSYCDTFI